MITKADLRKLDQGLDDRHPLFMVSDSVRATKGNVRLPKDHTRASAHARCFLIHHASLKSAESNSRDWSAPSESATRFGTATGNSLTV